MESKFEIKIGNQDLKLTFEIKIWFVWGATGRLLAGKPRWEVLESAVYVKMLNLKHVIKH